MLYASIVLSLVIFLKGALFLVGTLNNSLESLCFLFLPFNLPLDKLNKLVIEGVFLYDFLYSAYFYYRSMSSILNPDILLPFDLMLCYVLV